MSTQYDELVASYNEMRKLPGEVLEVYNMQQVSAPYIKGAKVLDLACGSGYYTNQLLSWGASQVVGVDISKGMIEAAKAATPPDKVQFIVADCSIPTKYDGGPFDIVFAGWLLNYAPDGAGLADMFRNIDINLNEGGRFFGVTTYPTRDPRKYNEVALQSKPLFWKDLWVVPTGDIEDGISATVFATTKLGQMQFDDYHLRKDVYEQAAKNAGLTKELTWKPTLWPKDDSELLRGKENVEEELAVYLKMPAFVIVTVEKG